MALREYLIGEVTQDYAEGLMTRREAMRRLGLLALSSGAAAALLAACGGDSGTVSGTGTTTATTTGTTRATPTSLKSEIIRFTGPSGQLQAAWAAAPEAKAAVLVIHENRGLTPHFARPRRTVCHEGTAPCVWTCSHRSVAPRR